MESIIAEIKTLFEKLDDTSRKKLLDELTQNETYGISIEEFAKLIQRMHKKNISFTITQQVQSDSIIISALLHTPYGDFVAVGKNKGVAKQRAVQKAFAELNNVNASK